MRQPSELVRAIDATIARFLEDGEPMAREIAEAVIAEHPDQVDCLADRLVSAQIQRMVRDRMKLSAPTVSDDAQFEMFDGLPMAIAFSSIGEEGVEYRYVSLLKATERHLILYEEMLAGGIAADNVSLQKLRTVHRRLQPIFNAHAGITVHEARKLLASAVSARG